MSGDSADSTTDEINGLNIGNQLTSGGNSTLAAEVDADPSASAGATTGDANANVNGSETIEAIDANNVDVEGDYSASVPSISTQAPSQ